MFHLNAEKSAFNLEHTLTGKVDLECHNKYNIAPSKEIKEFKATPGWWYFVIFAFYSFLMENVSKLCLRLWAKKPLSCLKILVKKVEKFFDDLQKQWKCVFWIIASDREICEQLISVTKYLLSFILNPWEGSTSLT